MPKYKIKLLGVYYTGKTKSELVEKTGISIYYLNKLLKNNTRKLIYNTDTKKIDVIDIKDSKAKPLLLQKFTDINKGIFKPTIKVKNNEIRNSLPKLLEVDVILEIELTYDISEEKNVKRYITRGIYDREGDQKGQPFKVSELNSAALEFADMYFNTLPDAHNISVKIFRVMTSSYKELEFKNMKLRERCPLRVEGYVSKVIYEKDCVRKYLLDNYGDKISNMVIYNLGDKDGVSPDELLSFCKKYRIKYTCYDINGNVVLKHIPEKINKNYKKLSIVGYNNHIYPLKTKEDYNIFTNKVGAIDENNIIVVSDILSELILILKSGTLPKILSRGVDIIGLIYNKQLYIEKLEYKQCLSIAKQFNVLNNIDELIGYNSICYMIEKNYIKKDIASYFPYCDRFVKSGYIYNNKDIDNDDLITVDKNKCYSYVLSSLDFIIELNYMTCKIIKNPTEIYPHYLYIAKPKLSSILLPTINVYSGQHLNICKEEGLEFDILEGLSTKQHPNYFSKMVNDIYSKVEPSIAKEILNRYIGSFECSEKISSIIELVKVGTKDEVSTDDGYIKHLDEYSLLFKNMGMKCKVVTRKPISIQVKDMARVVIYNKMKELNLNDKIIKQVNTDSFTYKNCDKSIIDNLDEGILTGWKLQEYNEIQPQQIIYNDNLSFFIKTIGKSVLYDCFAGSGKTYDIINNLIPKIDDYIVLTPSHASLREYKKNNLNCDVIQKYVNTRTIPKESIIIVDELGMLDKPAHYLIIKCKILEKTIYMYGDFNQLLPVNEDVRLNSEPYINYLANERKALTDNHRNNFTIKYYNKLFKMDRISAQHQVIKYSIKTLDNYSDDTTIICYRNKTVDKYNNIIMKKLNIKLNDIGSKIICKYNNLYNKSIYNNFTYTIIKKIKNNYIISDGTQEHTITDIELNKYFKPAYATTIYAIQGLSVKEYYYPEEDIKFIKDGFIAYTIISRLKTK